MIFLDGGTERTIVPASGTSNTAETKTLVFINPAA
jgi:hypothetical protein